MRDLALAGCVAAGTVVVNVLIAIVLAFAGALLVQPGMPSGIGAAFYLAAGLIGLVQLAWVTPAIVLVRNVRWAASGLAIGAAMTFLLNGVVIGGVVGGAYVLCGNVSMHP